jgi:hypothetical protein
MNHNGNGGGRAWNSGADLDCFDDEGSCYAFRKCLVPKANTGLPYLPPEVRTASIVINKALDELAQHVPRDREIVILHTSKGPLIALARRTHTGLVSDRLIESPEAALAHETATAQRTPTKRVKRGGAKPRRGRH